MTARPRRDRLQTLTGILVGNHRGVSLQVDGGGTWRLDAFPVDRQLIGKRVQVTGRRLPGDFDLFDVVERGIKPI